MATTTLSKKAMLAKKAAATTKKVATSREDQITAYIASECSTQYSPDHKEHLQARASIQENWYANKRARRMDDACSEVIPAGTIGYCIKVIPKEVSRKSFLMSTPSATGNFRWSKDMSNHFKYEVVPIKMTMNQYRGWKKCLFPTKAEAEAYKAELMNIIDTNAKNPYIAFKY